MALLAETANAMAAIATTVLRVRKGMVFFSGTVVQSSDLSSETLRGYRGQQNFRAVAKDFAENSSWREKRSRDAVICQYFHLSVLPPCRQTEMEDFLIDQHGSNWSDQ